MDTLQVIAEPRRRQILRLVWDNEMTAGDIARQFDISFPAISQHLKALRDANLVQQRKDGNRRYYRARPEALGAFREALEHMWLTDLGNLASAAEAAHRHDSERQGPTDAG